MTRSQGRALDIDDLMAEGGGVLAVDGRRVFKTHAPVQMFPSRGGKWEPARVIYVRGCARYSAVHHATLLLLLSLRRGFCGACVSVRARENYWSPVAFVCLSPRTDARDTTHAHTHTQKHHVVVIHSNFHATTAATTAITPRRTMATKPAATATTAPTTTTATTTPTAGPQRTTPYHHHQQQAPPPPPPPPPNTHTHTLQVNRNPKDAAVSAFHHNRAIVVHDYTGPWRHFLGEMCVSARIRKRPTIHPPSMCPTAQRALYPNISVAAAVSEKPGNDMIAVRTPGKALRGNKPH
jgi:hypothetical protein